MNYEEQAITGQNFQLARSLQVFGVALGHLGFLLLTIDSHGDRRGAFSLAQIYQIYHTFSITHPHTTPMEGGGDPSTNSDPPKIG